MRRRGGLTLLVVASALLLLTLPVAAQQRPIDPRHPPPPPPPDEPVISLQPPRDLPFAGPLEPIVVPPELPDRAAIPAGTRIAVVLDTPLSTRISKKGQLVTFRTSDPLRVGDLLEIPPETAFTGSVIEAKRPGAFGKPGVLRVKVDHINLSTGAAAEVIARLDSADSNASLTTDNQRASDLYNLVLYTTQGTLLGAQIRGGKGAAIGAGAGAAVALLIMMSRRGPDVYLEPGMPFVVVLDQPLELPAREISIAQQSYARAHRIDPSASSGPIRATTPGENRADDPETDPGRPKLKRRPRPPQI